MLEISEKDILQSLERDNPWWLDTTLKNTKIFSRKRAYFSSFIDIALNWNIVRTVILMGPRRVGKTVLLQQVIKYAIQNNNVSPKNILFASVDTPLYSGMALENLLNLFEKHTSHDPDSQRLVIFDEIQYLKDWEIHLKTLTDKYPNTKFIASGSAAAELKLKSTESGAGRFTDFFLPPLTFAEFLEFRDLDKKLIQEYDIGHTFRYETTDIEKLNQEFINYLNFGGYPEAVLNSEVQKNVKQFLGRDIIDKVLLRDLPSLYGIQDIQELNRLFTTLAYHSGQEINLESLSSSSGVAKQTISKYLEYLEAAFLIVKVRRVDDTGKTFIRERQFKIYLTNPSMRTALFSPLNEEDQAMGAMVETAIFSQWFHSDVMHNIHYARWKKGRKYLEVDLIRIHPATRKPTWAYEIKWSDRYIKNPSQELKGLIEFAKNNKKLTLPVGATTKTKTDKTSVDGITIHHFPCALHCYQIGKNLIEGRPA